MSNGAIVAATSGGAAAAAAAAARRRMLEEEEKLTTYNKDDLEGWEFKIVRVNTNYFKKPENLRRTMEEEARSGWEMVEKFDNQRVRFKRRVEKRKEDQYRQDLDPYRTTVGIGQGRLAFIIVGSILLGTGIALAIVFGIIRPLVE
jgi:hypothetical protein